MGYAQTPGSSRERALASYGKHDTKVIPVQARACPFLQTILAQDGNVFAFPNKLHAGEETCKNQENRGVACACFCPPERVQDRSRTDAGLHLAYPRRRHGSRADIDRLLVWVFRSRS